MRAGESLRPLGVSHTGLSWEAAIRRARPLLSAPIKIDFHADTFLKAEEDKGEHVEDLLRIKTVSWQPT